MQPKTTITALSLAIISMSVCTKWWYALPVDGPDTMYWGFPFPFVSEGWHTSLSLQIFVLEFMAELAIHLLFWFATLAWINKNTLKRPATRFLWQTTYGIAVLVCLLFGTITVVSNPIFKLYRSDDWTILDTGIQFIWIGTKRPDIGTFQPN